MKITSIKDTAYDTEENLQRWYKENKKFLCKKNGEIFTSFVVPLNRYEWRVIYGLNVYDIEDLDEFFLVLQDSESL